jgi:hypothetical protein
VAIAVVGLELGGCFCHCGVGTILYREKVDRVQDNQLNGI